MSSLKIEDQLRKERNEIWSHCAQAAQENIEPSETTCLKWSQAADQLLSKAFYHCFFGLTNVCILYGAEVTLWVRGDDASLEAVGPQVPSCASHDYGRPFAAIFEHYERDFYKIDPHLFSPAVVTLANLDTGASLRFGHTQGEVLRRSFSTRQPG